MPIIIAIILLSVTINADAGFRMFGPGGQFVNATETTEERAERERREAAHRARAAELERIANNNRAANQDVTDKKSKPIPHQVQPAEVAEDDGAAPGGHRRRIFRDKYGFGTPASMYNAIKQEREALKRERQAAERREINRRAQTVPRPRF